MTEEVTQSGSMFDPWEFIAPRMNEDLKGLQKLLEMRATSDNSLRPPLVHVIGPPRSGTTLALQVLTSSLDIGYISNVTAAFWEAPAVGVILSRHLNQNKRFSTFESDYGHAEGPQEPHEFGRFWQQLLGYRSMTYGDRVLTPINWDSVQETLNSITWAWQRPVVVKTFIGVWHLADLMEAVPGSIVIRVRRDPVDSVLSLLRMRDARLGSEPGWVSIVPQACSSASFSTHVEQVACQVISFEREIDQAVASVPTELIQEIGYKDLVSNPDRLVSSVQEALDASGYTIPRVTIPTVLPRRAPAHDPLRARVWSAVEKLRSEAPIPGAR